MDDAELQAKNEELHRRQAERAAGKNEPQSIGATLGKSSIEGLVERIRAIPRPENPEYEAAKATADANAEGLRLKRTGIPERYMAENFGTYKPRTNEERDNAAKVKAFVDVSREGYPGVLVMLGGVGTGKTHLGCACLHERSGQYVDVPTLEIEVECSRDFSAPENKLQVLNKYVKTDFLVIDEIGRASSPAAEKAALYYILNKRYGCNRPTVMITNFTAEELDAYLGAAMMDRIAEKRVKVQFTGQSYRRGHR